MRSWGRLGGWGRQAAMKCQVRGLPQASSGHLFPDFLWGLDPLHQPWPPRQDQAPLSLQPVPSGTFKLKPRSVPSLQPLGPWFCRL